MREGEGTAATTKVTTWGPGLAAILMNLLQRLLDHFEIPKEFQGILQGIAQSFLHEDNLNKWLKGGKPQDETTAAQTTRKSGPPGRNSKKRKN